MQEDNLSNLLKTFVKGSLIVFIGFVISKISSYLYKAIVARSFGQEIYGLFSLAILTFTLFVSIFSLGLHDGLLRFISFYRGKMETKKIQSIFRFSLSFIFLFGLLGAVLLFFFSETISITVFHNPELTIFLKWFAVFMPISMLAGMFHNIVLAYEKIGWFSFIANILSPAIQLILLVTFIFLGLKTESITLSYGAGILAILLSTFLVCRHFTKEVFIKPNIEKEEKSKVIKKLISYSWPIMLFGLVSSVFSLIDSFVIGHFKTASDVGIYNAAFPLAVLLEFVPSLFLQLFLPVITKEYSKGNFELIKDLSKQIGKWIFILNLPLLIITILFPGVLINFVFGPGYIGAQNSLRMLSTGLFFFSLFLISSNLLSMVGKSKTILFNILIVSSINLVLDIILIPKYGIDGASFSTMLCYILLGLLQFFAAKHHTSISPVKLNMLKILLVAAIPAVILFYVKKIIVVTPLTMIITGVLFLLFYFLLIFLTRCFDKNDLMILRAIKNKLTKT